MKIGVIMMYWYPYEGALQPIYKKIFERLISDGNQVSLICSLPHFRIGRSESWGEYRCKLYQQEKLGELAVHRTWVWSPRLLARKWESVARLINYISYFLSSFCLLKKINKSYDLFFVPSTPPVFNFLHGLIVRYLYGKPFIFNVQDMYPDILVHLGLLKKGFLYNALAGLEKKTYDAASVVFVISESMRDNLLRKGVPAQKVAVVPNFQDTDFIRPLPKVNPFSEKYKIDKKKVVLFAGNMGPAHGLEVVIEAASHLVHLRSLVFAFIGRGKCRPDLMNLARYHRLDNVIFPDLQPYKNMPDVWASSDLSLVSLRKGFGTDSIPSKVFAIMASGRPILAVVEKGCEIYHIAKASKGGIWVEPGDSRKLAEAIATAFEDEQHLKRLGNNAREYVLKEFHFEAVYSKYLKNMEEAVKQSF